MRSSLLLLVVFFLAMVPGKASAASGGASSKKSKSQPSKKTPPKKPSQDVKTRLTEAEALFDRMDTMKSPLGADILDWEKIFQSRDEALKMVTSVKLSDVPEDCRYDYLRLIVKFCLEFGSTFNPEEAVKAADSALNLPGVSTAEKKVILERIVYVGSPREYMFAGTCSAASDAAMQALRSASTKSGEALLADLSGEDYRKAAIELANQYVQEGNFAPAKKLYEKLLNIREDQATSWYGAANMYLAQGDRKNAMEHIRRLANVPMSEVTTSRASLGGMYKMARAIVGWEDGSYPLDDLQLPRDTGAMAFPTPQQAKYSETFVPLKGIKVELGAGLEAKRGLHPLERLVRVKCDRFGIGKSGFTLAVSIDPAKAPKKSQGYALTVSEKGAAVCGYDYQGAVWGVVSFIQVMDQKNKSVRICSIQDWPDAPIRGLDAGNISGQLEYNLFMKLNFVMDQHGPYFDGKAKDAGFEAFRDAAIEGLARSFKDFGIEIGFGERRLTFWSMALTSPQTYKLILDSAMACGKAGAAYIPLFDDIRYPFSAIDKRAGYKNAKDLDTKFLNQVFTEVRKQYPDFHMIFCPPYYWGSAGWPHPNGYEDDRDDYLTAIGKNMERDIDIFWTGTQVRGYEKKPEYLTWFSRLTKRKPFIWQNAPGPRGRLNYMADEMGGWISWHYKDFFKKDIAGYMMHGFGMHGDAVPAGTLADASWNNDAYDKKQSLKRVMDILCGSGLYEIMRPAVLEIEKFEKFRKDPWEMGGYVPKPCDPKEKAELVESLRRAEEATQKANQLFPLEMKRYSGGFQEALYGATMLIEKL